MAADPELADHLAETLIGETRSDRIQAALRALGWVGSARHAEVVAGFLDDHRPGVLVAASVALGRLGGEVAISRLATMIGTPANLIVRAEGSLAATGDPRAFEVLKEHAERGSAAAIQALPMSDPLRAYPVLRALVAEPPTRRADEYALKALRWVETEEADAFVRDIAKGQTLPALQRTAIQSLRVVRSEDEWKQLLKATGGVSPVGIANKSPESLERLLVLARSGPRRWTIEALRAFGRVPYPALDAYLEEEASSDNPRRYRYAVQALSQRGTDASLRSLLHLLETPSPSERKDFVFERLADSWRPAQFSCCADSVAQRLIHEAKSDGDGVILRSTVNRAVAVTRGEVPSWLETEVAALEQDAEFLGRLLQGSAAGRALAEPRLLRLAQDDSNESSEDALRQLFSKLGFGVPLSENATNFLYQEAARRPIDELDELITLPPGLEHLPILLRLIESEEHGAIAVSELTNSSVPDAASALRSLAQRPSHPGGDMLFRWLVEHDPDLARAHLDGFLEHHHASTLNAILDLLGMDGLELLMDWMGRVDDENAVLGTVAVVCTTYVAGIPWRDIYPEGLALLRNSSVAAIQAAVAESCDR